MASSKEWPKVTSRDHPSESCVPCFICGKKQPRYSHFSSLTKEQQLFFRAHFHKEISRGGCMCRAHVREADKHHSSLQYIPVWKKEGGSKLNTTACMHPNSNVTTCNSRIITCSSTAFTQLLPGNGTTISVCETHYQQLYRQLHTLAPCAGCGKTPKARQRPFNRHSPDTTSVSTYLSENELDGNFTVQGLL